MPRSRVPRVRAAPLAIAVAALLTVAACTGSPAAPASDGHSTSPSAATPTSPPGTSPRGSQPPPATTTTSVPRTPQTVAGDLDVPWGLAFLPDGTALLTLRDQAQLLRLRVGQAPTRIATIAGVRPGGEGGLLGVAVSPSFGQDHRVFLYFTAADDNRVVRLTLSGNTASTPVPILTGIPKAGHHNGGRLAFGPDGYLYVTTGDAGQTARAQDRSSLGGKILRITQDGRPAPGNPFGDSPVWSMGHRNVQGIAWDADGRMYASEFGQDTWDELNLIRPGLNYGWPIVEGRGGRPGLVDPLAEWRTADASPSGIAVADGAVYMAALRGESLWRIPLLRGTIGTPKRLLAETYGRLRDVVLAPDGRLWILTSNTFRGTPRPHDDRVIALPLASLR